MAPPDRAVMGIDRRGSPRAEQRAQTAARCLLDDDDAAAGGEQAKSLRKRRDALLGPHARQQPLLIVDDDQIERAVFERDLPELARFDFEQEPGFLGGAARARRLRVVGHDSAHAPAQPHF